MFFSPFLLVPLNWERDLESDDQVITRGSAILVGVVYFHKMKQVPTITF
jgi:hypothetical protein